MPNLGVRPRLRSGGSRHHPARPTMKKARESPPGPRSSSSHLGRVQDAHLEHVAVGARGGRRAVTGLDGGVGSDFPTGRALAQGPATTQVVRTAASLIPLLFVPLGSLITSDSRCVRPVPPAIGNT